MGYPECNLQTTAKRLRVYGQPRMTLAFLRKEKWLIQKLGSGSRGKHGGTRVWSRAVHMWLSSIVNSTVGLFLQDGMNFPEEYPVPTPLHSRHLYSSPGTRHYYHSPDSPSWNAFPILKCSYPTVTQSPFIDLEKSIWLLDSWTISWQVHKG